MTYTIIIPARLKSERLPNKMLADIGGKPMIQHTWERAKETDAKDVYIATDSQEIMSAVKKFSPSVIFTNGAYNNGTERVCAVARKLNLSSTHKIVNLQGDEPFISPEAIDDMVHDYKIREFGVSIATLATRPESKYWLMSPDNVKVVTDYFNNALLFTREPYSHSHLQHIGCYVYSYSQLRHLVELDTCELEQEEELEQLRWLWHQKRIYVHITKNKMGPGINNSDDLTTARLYYGNRGV